MSHFMHYQSEGMMNVLVLIMPLALRALTLICVIFLHKNEVLNELHVLFHVS